MPERTCSIDGCEEPRKTRGFCASHYARWKRHGDDMSREPIRYPRTDLCSVADCLRPVEGYGHCHVHRYRVKRYGDPETVKVDWNTDRRFRANYIEAPSGCWIWLGRDGNQFGHRRWTVQGKRVLVHRWAYERFVGPIPNGLTIDHLCRVPRCVNPMHLQPVTQWRNVWRAQWSPPARNSRKTHCKRGHPLSGPNLQIRSNKGRPARQCRTCTNRRAQEYQERVRRR